ncbi:MAG: diguanylate cyclase [Solirubrobacteraceae bacterium]
MSFRGRLTLFFVLIVIVPMVSVTVVIFSLISNNEEGKANAAVSARLDTATNLAREAQSEAERAARLVGGDVTLATALRRGDDAAADRRADVLAARFRLLRLVIIGNDRHTVANVGRADAIFPASINLLADGTKVGTLQVSVQSADQYAGLVEHVTDLDVIVRRRGGTLASTIKDTEKVALPEGNGTVSIGGTDFRSATIERRDFRDGLLQVTLLRDEAETAGDVTNSRLIVGGVLLGFFLLAFAFALAVSRSLQSQVASFLHAARRLGGGEFDTKVPTVGKDEFAELGAEFNTMAAQLESRLEELREERTRVERSMRRLGEAVASNLDRDALLGIVVETAMDGVGAAGGRAAARSADGTLTERVAAGRPAGLEQVLAAAEEQAATTGEASEVNQGEASALAHPLHGSEGGPDVLGVVAVGRLGRTFTQADRELFSYLAGQAAVSLENVDLHETVQRQAVTDELTGLFNRGRFDDLLAAEVERTRRFPDQSVGLVMLDIDNFKKVNDTHGHQMGDDVLREVARVLRETSREIDYPARYGGEELAVVLPGTDIEGAFDMAERVRSGIEALSFPLGNGNDDVLKVTASFGAASGSGDDTAPAALIGAADTALYEAKRGGKNKTVRAGVG